MPAKRKAEVIKAKYFVWLLILRQGVDVYYADGRSNNPSVGRHSLATKNREEAIAAIERLDLVCAVKAGLADRKALDQVGPNPLELSKGWDLYRRHATRPRVAGGVKPASAKRYRAVFDKFLFHASGIGLTVWNQVTTSVLEGYAALLDGEGYAYRTEYLELTTLKQAIGWMIESELLPATCMIRLKLQKPDGTDTYCWRPEEVGAMIDYCRLTPGLDWLGDVVIALARTGLRISELASLRWRDIDLAAGVIQLKDESARAPRPGVKRRETKSGRGRTFPIHDDLRRVLEKLDRSQDGLVFHGPRGGVLKPDTIRNILIREVLAPLAPKFPTPSGEIGFANGRLHSFRHYFCSACATAGVPEPVVMLWLGHRQSSMVHHYFHLHHAEAQRQMQRLSFAKETGGNSPSVDQ